MTDFSRRPRFYASASLGNLAEDDVFYLGRQPIVGRHRELLGYELLFRSGTRNMATVVDDFAATATVIHNAFLSLGIQGAIGDHLGFINVNEDVLMSDVIEILPRDRIVLEILEHVPITPSLIARCRELKEQGYHLALDDVVQITEAQARLFDCLTYLKLDVTAMAESQLQEFIALGHRHRLTLLAEKVETEEQFDAYRALGVDCFQGYFFARPTVLSGRAVPPSKILLIKLMRLLASDADVDTLERALKEAPDLTVRLLRMANSVAMKQVNKVSSLRNAILVLGRVQIGRLLQIMLFAGHFGADLASDPLVQLAAIRGRMMEHLAKAQGLSHLCGEAYIVGILSLADAVFGQSMVELLKMLNLDTGLEEALLYRRGPLGRLLILVETSEHPESPAFIAALVEMRGTDAAAFNRMQVDAMRWASSL